MKDLTEKRYNVRVETIKNGKKLKIKHQIRAYSKKEAHYKAKRWIKNNINHDKINKSVITDLRNVNSNWMDELEL